MRHKTFIFKQFEGTDFKFDTYSYSSHKIQTTTIHKIFKTNSSFHVKQRTKEKV